MTWKYTFSVPELVVPAIVERAIGNSSNRRHDLDKGSECFVGNMLRHTAPRPQARLQSRYKKCRPELQTPTRQQVGERNGTLPYTLKLALSNGERGK